MKPPFGKVWTFETSDFWIYQRFLKVLKLYDIVPCEEYAVMYDNSSCDFCCTKDTRIRVEYVFRRSIGLDMRYLMDLDSYQNRYEMYKEERYAIY